jgi:hypothetical protein
VKLHVHFQTGEIKVDEIVEGATSEQIVGKMQARVAQEAGFLVGQVVKRMTPLQFAQEAIRRYNAATKDNAPIPQSCDEFLKTGVEKKFATVLPEGG